MRVKLWEKIEGYIDVDTLEDAVKVRALLENQGIEFIMQNYDFKITGREDNAWLDDWERKL